VASGYRVHDEWFGCVASGYRVQDKWFGCVASVEYSLLSAEQVELLLFLCHSCPLNNI